MMDVPCRAYGKDARLRRISTGIKPNQVKLDAVIATAMILSGVYKGMATKRGMNYSTNQDQIKVLMKNEWERNHTIEFTVDDVLILWNNRTNGKPHTKQQVAAALQGLKSIGHVVITSGGPGQVGKYALSSVIEEMTDPSNSTPVGKKENPELEISNDSDHRAETVIIQSLMAPLTHLDKRLTGHFDAIINALETSDQTNKNYAEAIDALGRLVGGLLESYGEQTNILNSNNEVWRKFTEETMSNFREWDDFLKNYESHSDDQVLREAYRSGYKDGFKDGREDFKSEFKPTNAIESKGQN